MDNSSRNIGKTIIRVCNNFKRNFNNIDSIKTLNEISGTNGFIIKYLYDSKTPVYQKDLENEYSITRSTCSKILSLMEKKNLIERKSVSSDARLRQIVLTDKAISLVSSVDMDIAKFDTNLVAGFSEEEKIEFYNYLIRIQKNLEENI